MELLHLMEMDPIFHLLQELYFALVK